jgi:predicted MFS family arabinose efflux permease
LIASLGVVAGVRVLGAVAVGIAIAVLLLQQYGFGGEAPRESVRVPGGKSRRLPPDLRRLLAAECLVRFGEGIAASFIVLYVTQVSGLSLLEFGTLYAIQQSVAIASYLPGARLTAWTGRPSTVALTFFFFAAFPLAVSAMSSYQALVVAFVIGGLKEIGEPARKALIVDLTSDDHRPSEVGRYYAIRNFLIVPAGIAGGVLWQYSPQLPLVTAFAVSFAGLIVFLTTRPRNIAES